MNAVGLHEFESIQKSRVFAPEILALSLLTYDVLSKYPEAPPNTYGESIIEAFTYAANVLVGISSRKVVEFADPFMWRRDNT